METTGPGPSDRPPVLGSWSVDAGALRFRPRFPPKAEIGLLASFDGPALAELLGIPDSGLPTLRERRTVPLPVETLPEPTRLLGVRPRLDPVPANLLRLYLEFSAPMTRRDVPSSVRLLDHEGVEIRDAFVEIPEGLWDPGSRRLTLILHPGRIKRGVGPHEALGPPLREGERVRLVVDRDLRDATGRPLAEAFEHTFRIGPADRESPEPSRWSVDVPKDPEAELRLRFPSPLDPAIARRALWVEDAAGRALEGTVEVAEDGRSWRFAPDRPWEAGRHRIRIEPFLEDPAGNRIGELFDHELTGDPSPELGTPAPLDFEIEN